MPALTDDSDPNNVPTTPDEPVVPPIQEQQVQPGVGYPNPQVVEDEPLHVYRDDEQDVDAQHARPQESLIDRVKGFFESLRDDGKPVDHG